jgi:hypothetical protein
LAITCALREALDHARDEFATAAANGDLPSFAADRLDVRDRVKASHCRGVRGRDDDGSLGAVPSNEFGGCADIDDATVVDDRHPVA